MQTKWMTRFYVATFLLLVGSFVSAQIIETRTGKETNELALVKVLKSADIVLLGELHDNRLHHQLRGQLIAQFADAKRSIVSEHIPSPGTVVFRSDTKADLEAAGFDPEGWEWPAHQSLYDALRAKNLNVVGGNLPKADARKIFLQGVSGLPERMAETYAQSRLDADAERALDRDLVEGHCGQLPDKYLLRMRFAQRITDLSLTHALLDNRPAVLVAGNGHVRKDYGVPQILSSVDPSLRVVSIGFLEQGSDPKDLLHSVAGQYDFIWITERAERKDPCENFKLK